MLKFVAERSLAAGTGLSMMGFMTLSHVYRERLSETFAESNENILAALNKQRADPAYVADTGYGVGLFGKAELPEGKPVTIQIPAGNLFSLNIGGTKPGPDASTYFGCDALVSFTPQSGRSYVAEFRYHGNQCRISLGQEENGVEVYVPSRQRKYVVEAFDTRCAD